MTFQRGEIKTGELNKGREVLASLKKEIKKWVCVLNMIHSLLCKKNQKAKEIKCENFLTGEEREYTKFGK